MNGLSTPRQVMDALNVLHNYRLRVTVDRKLEFAPQPDKPIYRIGQWSGADFKDASKNSGDEIYNQSIIEGTGPDGNAVRVRRYAGQLPDLPLGAAVPSIPNASFGSNTSGWIATAGTTLTRDTSVFDSSPASMRWNNVSGTISSFIDASFTGTFKRGVTYVLEWSERTNGATDYSAETWLGDVPLLTFLSDTGAWAQRRLAWTPSQDVAVARFRLWYPVILQTYWIDSLRLSEVRPTLPDRRGFTRTHITSMSQAIVPEISQQIADTFLQTHKRTPLKGDITVKGRHGVRRMLGDATVPPSELLLHTGELVHLSDQVDPDTGAVGRDAPIDSVTWNADEDTASVSLDAQRDNLAALLARYDLVAGNGR